MAIIDTRRELSIMESVNEFIDDLHRSLGLADTEFFCECGHIGCMERITLTRAEFTALRADGQPVLAAAHAVPRRAAAELNGRGANGSSPSP